MEAVDNLVSDLLRGQVSQQSVEAAVVQAFVSGTIDQVQKEELLGRVDAVVFVRAGLSLIEREENLAALRAVTWPNINGLQLAESVRKTVAAFLQTQDIWVERRLKELRVSTRRD